jgi:hypothetical protein
LCEYSVAYQVAPLPYARVYATLLTAGRLWAPQPRAAAGRPTDPRFDTSRAETQLSSQEAVGVMPGWILGLKIVN